MQPIDRVATSSSTLSASFRDPVEAGNIIEVNTKIPANAVTDSLGNTYSRIESEDPDGWQEWRATVSRSGPVVVTVTTSQPGENEIRIKEKKTGDL